MLVNTGEPSRCKQAVYMLHIERTVRTMGTERNSEPYALHDQRAMHADPSDVRLATNGHSKETEVAQPRQGLHSRACWRMRTAHPIGACSTQAERTESDSFATLRA